jgi:hypothetical protein
VAIGMLNENDEHYEGEAVQQDCQYPGE